jgi:glycine cleavage system H protein
VVSSGPSVNALDAPTDRWYSVDHHWAQVVTQNGLTFESSGADLSRERIRIGLTSYAQDAVGALRFVALPRIGQSVVANQACGEVEASKAVSDVYSPVSGVVVVVNEQLVGQPGLLNDDPYGVGWICEIETNSSISVFETHSLLTSEQYLDLLGVAK